ncbi:NAD(P)/FAD-dependent oxidoreductase [Longispora albida]|uniref:NAD(P)/FAD-dependent oxidoreductase n=1 Tax=Longispora albida TaxID=203523 RepID=UPI0003611762|nr:FAD-dependent oxidoreductase [Longispora albida]
MHSDVAIIGAGIIGAATAYELARAGVSVTVIDRGALAGGTTSGGEGNLLVSDKPPGAELDLARDSLRRWRELDPGDIELEPKGGILVARSPEAAKALAELTATHREAGVDGRDLSLSELAEREPHLTRDVAGAAYYPEDSQVQPVLATAALLTAARRLGATLLTGAAVTGIEPGRAVRTASTTVHAGQIVIAAGPWSGEVAKLAGADLPIQPRRGMVLVTGAVPKLVHHKVYDASYLAAVASDDAGLQASAVVEGTPAGPILIGSTRERIGFDARIRVEALRVLAQGALGLFPSLAGVKILRAYGGFRPYAPDHLPVIGEDPHRPGLWYATGHEGAGIGLAPATGALLAALMTGGVPSVDPVPFSPARFG